MIHLICRAKFVGTTLKWPLRCKDILCGLDLVRFPHTIATHSSLRIPNQPAAAANPPSPYIMWLQCPILLDLLFHSAECKNASLLVDNVNGEE